MTVARDDVKRAGSREGMPLKTISAGLIAH